MFFWCHISHLNSVNKKPKYYKEILETWLIKTLSFLFLKKVIIRLNQKIISVLMHLNMKISKCTQFVYWKKNFKITLIYSSLGNEVNSQVDKSQGNKPHYICIKVLIDLCTIK